ncbi:MAG: cell division protein ZapA [bacterium]
MSGGKVTAVTVEIFGSKYKIKGDAEAEYIKKLAQYVDAKMNEIAISTSTTSVAKVAILAALNVADELYRLREERASSDGDNLNQAIEYKTRELLQLIDNGIGSISIGSGTKR